MTHSTLAALYRHDAWASQRMLDAASTLPQADFVRDLKSSHGSIRDTLVHIVWAEWIWLQRWHGGSPTLVSSPAEFPDVDSLRERLIEVDAERSMFLQGLTEDGLRQVAGGKSPRCCGRLARRARPRTFSCTTTREAAEGVGASRNVIRPAQR